MLSTPSSPDWKMHGWGRGAVLFNKLQTAAAAPSPAIVRPGFSKAVAIFRWAFTLSAQGREGLGMVCRKYVSAASIACQWAGNEAAVAAKCTGPRGRRRRQARKPGLGGRRESIVEGSLLAKRRLRRTCGAPSTWPAMLILTCSSKLQLLESVLRKGLPETLSVCGAVMHINHGNPAQHEVVVDSWPEFKAVLTRPRKEVVKDKRDCYANLHAAFYREEDACRALLENKDALDWDKAFQLQGLQDGLYQAVKDMAEARHVHMEPYFYQAVLHPDAATFFQNQLRSEPLHLGTLSPSDAPLVNDTWAFASNDRSLRYLRSLIEIFPNACLLDQKGQLVAWSLSDALGRMTHGYVLPEYQGKGHMKTVLQALGRKLHTKGFVSYGGVLPENQNSKKLLISLGFHLLSLRNYVLLFTPNHLK